jgi:ABC-type transport system substrate-binding protein
VHKRAHHIAALVLVTGMLLSYCLAEPSDAGDSTDLSDATVYIDKVGFKTLPNQDLRVLEILSGEVDMHTGFLHPYYLASLQAEPAVSTSVVLRNGYGEIVINCRDYPLNISGFRRAFALAFDKTLVKDIIYDGYCQEHDSIVPRCNPWCIEEELFPHYYNASPGAGNTLLDGLGFSIDPESGFRLAPNGTAFKIWVDYLSPDEVGSGSAWLAADALRALHIDAESRYIDYQVFLDRVYGHGSYDMVVMGRAFRDFSLDWLAEDFSSETVDVYKKNPSNFQNESFDLWIDQLLHGSTYEEVTEAASEMQRIIHQNVPAIVIYENTYAVAYRNDVFTGQVIDAYGNVGGPWTLRNIRRTDGRLGGTVVIAIPEEPDTLNIYHTNDDPYSAATCMIGCLYSSLYVYGPSGTPKADLATSMIVETGETNPNVPEDHVRFTFDIVQNATWNDNIPLTAQDVVYTYTYAMMTNNSLNQHLDQLYSAYSPTPYRVVLEFEEYSYWTFFDFAFAPVIPYHVFRDDTGIGLLGLAAWEPVFDPASPHVTSGPFNFTYYGGIHDSHYGRDVPYYEMSFHPFWHYANSRVLTTNTTATTGLADSTRERLFDWTRAGIGIAIGSSSAVIAFILLSILKNHRTVAA